MLLDAGLDFVPEPEPVEREDAQVRNAPFGHQAPKDLPQQHVDGEGKLAGPAD